MILVMTPATMQDVSLYVNDNNDTNDFRSQNIEVHHEQVFSTQQY